MVEEKKRRRLGDDGGVFIGGFFGGERVYSGLDKEARVWDHIWVVGGENVYR